MIRDQNEIYDPADVVVRRIPTLEELRAKAEIAERAFYSMHTGWWSLEPEHLGTLENGIPCDPRRSVLFEHHNPSEWFAKSIEAQGQDEDAQRAFCAAYHGVVEVKGRPWAFREFATYRALVEKRDSRARDPCRLGGALREYRPTVFVMSPFSGDVERNLAYARAAVSDCIARGEAPFAPHLIYPVPGVLNDDEPGQRLLGIECGLAWARKADRCVAYIDLGESRGMRQEIEALGRWSVQRRSIPGWPR